MRLQTKLRLFGYFIATAVLFAGVFLPEYFFVYLLMLTVNDLIIWFSIAFSIPILYIVSTIIFGILHSQLICRIFLPEIKPGKYKHGTDEAYLYGVRIVSPSIFKSMLKAFSFVPHLYNLILGYCLRLYGLKAGKNVYFASGTMIDSHFVTIGDNTFVGLRAIISAHVNESQYTIIAPVKIGRNCTIGGNTIIAPGAEIGDNCVIGVNSFVKKGQKIPANTVWGGSPAHFIKEKTPISESRNDENT
ncbi:MAG: acyltransferase [Candidatus Hodarchaeales archaeon]